MSDVGLLCESLRQRTGVAGPRRPIAPETIEPVAQIGTVTAQPALDDQGRDLCGQQRLPVAGSQHDHPRETRRQRQSPDVVAGSGQGPRRIERSDGLQHGAGLRKRGIWRRVEPRQIALRPPRAPGGGIEQQAGHVGGEDGWAREGLQRSGTGFLPEAIADARLRAAGTAPPLVRRSARDPLRLQPRQADRRLVARHTGEAAVQSPRARPRSSAMSPRWT